MKGEKLDLLVAKCAKLAAKGKNIEAYIILYKTKEGPICYDKDGSDTNVLGMLEIAKKGIIVDYF